MFSGINDLLSQIVNLFQWWVVIAPWERAIRVRRGKKITVLGPGLHLRIPSLDRFFVQATRKRYMNTPTQAVTTLDGKAITISGGTSYTIEDIGALYNILTDAQDVIQVETMARVAEFIATHNMVDVTPESVQQYVNANLNFEHYGLGGIKFLITDFVAVRTYRIIQSNPKDWGDNQALNTNSETAKGPR
jgi:regulator of protease activity HflC (stomatin/prohibitin superfamily)